MLRTICLTLFVGVCKSVPEAVYQRPGSTYQFICPYKKLSTNNVIWVFTNKSGTLISVSDGTYITPTNPAKDRVSIVGNNTAGEYNLQLSYLRESDEGVYRCSVNNGAGFQTKEYSLDLFALPSSLTLQDKIDQKIIGIEGQNLTLRCTATGGKPTPSVTIILDNNSITSAQSVEYTIPTLQRHHDKQTVRCEANSSALASPMVDSATLYLYLKPLQPTFSSDPISAEETRPLVVSCTSTGSRPAATFKWMIGLALITSGISTTVYNTDYDTYTVTSTLTYSVDRTHNGQTITCSAFNSVFTNGADSSKTLVVNFAPDITVKNDTYNQNTATRTVTCFSAGNPTTYIYYRWQHKSTYGELIRELDGGQNGVLTLPSVSVEDRYQDTGEYVCTASNGISGRNGKIQQTGSGYVTVNAQPKFTNGNNDTQYGEFGKDVDIYVNAYSVPKYTSLKWYKGNIEIIMGKKYTFSELAAVVYDTFHGTKVQLNSYRLTLTIKNLVESEFNVSYRVELSNGVGQPVVYTTLLISASAPETPINFKALQPSESSIVVQWEAGYNGGHEQTFYVEYREFGFNVWTGVHISDSKQKEIQTYTLTDLQDGTLYELRMHAENRINSSFPTETLTIKTIKGNKLPLSECAIAGVAGGLSAVILLQFIINVVLVILLRKETGKKRTKAKSARRIDKAQYHNTLDCKERDEQGETRDGQNKTLTESTHEYETLDMKDKPSTFLTQQDKHNKTLNTCVQEYETLGTQDNPTTYSALLSQQDNRTLTGSKLEYETLGIKDNPNTYSALRSEQGQKQSDSTVDFYESVREPSKSTVYANSKVKQGHSEYTNVKI